MIKRLLISICCMLACVSGVQAEGWLMEQLPSPKIHGQNYYVSNPDSVLSPDAELRINELCARLEANTGVELAVVAVNKFDDRHVAYIFALDLFNYWGIGNAEKNTGVLFFLAKDSRDVQIITGDGISGILTDAKCGHILDSGLKYLSKNEFDKGTLRICKNIEKQLMEDENRAELYLGWKPEPAKMNIELLLYLLAGFILMLLLTWWAYRSLQGKPGQKKEAIQDNAFPVRLVTAILMFFFPLPLLLFYIALRIICNRVQSIPPNCTQCGHPMELLSDEEKAQHLTPAQQFDEKIDSFQYEVWRCTDCHAIETKPINGKNYYKYDECPKCGANAMETKSREIIAKASSKSNGKQKKSLVCTCCGHQMEKFTSLRKEFSSSGSSYRSDYNDKDDYSSSSWGSFWGDSSSSSSGSWGGGRSSGGGAGRKF